MKPFKIWRTHLAEQKDITIRTEIDWLSWGIRIQFEEYYATSKGCLNNRLLFQVLCFQASINFWKT